jgi:parallel beta-helix repeat protein
MSALVAAGISIAQTNIDITPLGPPGSAASWMKNLNQVEPRTLISSLPFTITNTGSYYISGNLTGIPGTNGLTIKASSVEIDLRGFALTGVSGSMSAVTVPRPWAGDPATYSNITIHSGVISGWGDGGISMDSASDGKVFEITASGNGANSMGPGIAVGHNWQVLDCGAFNNAGDGFYAPSENDTLRGCVSRNNGGQGFRAGYASLVQNCFSYWNYSTGIVAYGQTTVRDCMVIGSVFGDGIAVDDDCRVEGNQVLSCGNGTGIHGGGIYVKNGSRVVDNYVIQNAYGIKVQPAGSGNLFIRNSARGNYEMDFMTTMNNLWGQVVTNSPQGSTINNMSPWLNFVH